MQKVTILGSTGSIGVSTLDVLAQHADCYEVFALAANKQVDKLLQQCLQFKPRFAVLCDETAAKQFRELAANAKLSTQLLVGEKALCEVAAHEEVDIVMAAIVGSVGLDSTLAAIKADKKILLANKETLVMAGDLMLQALRQSKAQLLPVDSEHSAIFQCLPPAFMAGRLYPKVCPRDLPKNFTVSKIVLTASGGATRDLPLEALSKVSAEFACTHPNWSMGKKITVDSATMMNKALEVIEAYYLFGLPWQQLEVILHPQSIIHSMVYYDDGSVMAQLGQPDMRTPIAVALAWPERVSARVATLDLITSPALSFATLDLQRYPCLSLAYQALQIGGLAATILNAANEIAVERFLNGEISFTDIYILNASMLANIPANQGQDLAAIKAIDLEVREKAKNFRNNGNSIGK